MVYVYTFTIIFLYYKLFTYNEKHKAFICMFLTLLSTFVSYYNRDIVFTKPWETGPYVFETNALFQSYLIIDLLYNFYIKNYRKDLIFHHIFILIPHLLKPHIIGITFPIMGEIYSTGAIFNLSSKNNLIYRAITIITIRMFIWYKLFLCSFIAESQNNLYDRFSPLIISIGMFILDLYWLKSIFLKLKENK